MTSTKGKTPGLLAQVMGLDHCLLVVRHGRTVWNDEDRMSTRTDISLTDAGRDEAEQVGVALRGATFDFAWTSPLERARETASIALAGADSPGPVVDERLTEPDGGPFEGVTFSELETGQHAAAFAAFMDSENPLYPDACAPLEESVGNARAFLANVASMPGRHFAVAHGAIMRIMAAEFLGMNPAYYRRLRIDNCHGALWRFWSEPPHQLAGWNLPPVSARRDVSDEERGEARAPMADSAKHGDLGQYAGMVGDAPDGALVDRPSEMPGASASGIRYGDLDALDRHDPDEDWRSAQARYVKKHGGFVESDPGPHPQSQPEELTTAEQEEFTAKMSRMSIERPFDSSEYLDNPRIRYDDGEPSPWGDDPMAPVPKHKPKAKPADG